MRNVPILGLDLGSDGGKIPWQVRRALELGHAGKHCQHHASCRRSRVRPRFGLRAEARPDLVQLLGDVEPVAGLTREPAQGRHDL